MIEAPKIIGPVPKIINETLSYLRTNVIKQRITKPSDTEKSIKVFNYPYQAFEEAVVNALYHRDYIGCTGALPPRKNGGKSQLKRSITAKNQG